MPEWENAPRGLATNQIGATPGAQRLDLASTLGSQSQVAVGQCVAAWALPLVRRARPVVLRGFPSNALRAKAIREAQVIGGGNGRGVVLLTSAGATGRGGPPDPGLGRSVEGLLRAPGKGARARVGRHPRESRLAAPGTGVSPRVPSPTISPLLPS